MQLALIFYALGWGGALLAGLMLIPLAMSFGDPILARNFIIGFLVTSFVSGALILIGNNAPRHRARPADLFMTMLLFWVLLPLPACIPLVGDIQVRGLMAAYFEAVSGLTTSGASVMTHPELAAKPIIIWRALLNWVGGLWTLVFAVAVLAPAVIGGIGLHASPFLRVDEHATLPVRLRKPLIIIFAFYAPLTLFGFLLIWLGGADIVSAAALALSAVSTGGFSPVPDALPLHYPFAAVLAVAVMCFIGAVSIPILISLSRLDGKMLVRDNELRIFILFILLFAFVSMLALRGADWQIFLQSISLASTSGFIFAPHSVTSQWPVVWIILPLILGGMSLSTAGGCKIIRVIMLAKNVQGEVLRLPYPSSAQPRKSAARVGAGDPRAVWAYFVILLLTASGGVIIAGILGVPLADAWPLVLASLGNGNSALPLIASDYLPVLLGTGGQVFICGLMVAGRVELLLLFVLFNPSYWRLAR